MEFLKLKNKKILITGGTGLVGNSFSKYENCILLSSSECNLLDYFNVVETIQKYKPDIIIHLAAKVGGILGNTNNNLEYFHTNLTINKNILKAANECNIEYVVSMLSTCIYPIDKYPYKETELHNGEPHPSNYGYAFAKRMLEVDTRLYRQTFNRKYICVVPNNIFGENDNFDLQNGHVIPSVIRKVYESKLKNEQLILWGDGSPLREFTYSHDISKSIFKVLENVIENKITEENSLVNIGNSNEISIKDVSEKVCKNFEYEKQITWDITKPLGVFRKPSDNTKFKNMFSTNEEYKTWYTNFDYALELTCRWFKETYPNIRGL